MRNTRAAALKDPSNVPAVVYHEEIAELISWIDSERPPGAVLCFLPGWHDITSVAKHLDQLTRGRARDVVVLPLHSKLTFEQQDRIFTTPPAGVRKVILSTNVAETSVTINDVVYVVDTGIHKEERLIAHKGISSLDNQWVSAANVHQRKGRAGRVQPGECYHLYTRSQLLSMGQYPIPEILRVSLEKVVLDIKTYNEVQKAHEFLSEMPEPPSMEAIDRAVSDLIQLGALDDTEKLTELGTRISKFTTHPKLSKALVNAAFFGCLDSMLSVAAVLSSDVELFQSSLEDKSLIVSTKQQFDTDSDHVAFVKIYQQWNALVNTSQRHSPRYHSFVSQHLLRENSLYMLKKLRKLLLDQLCECGIIDHLPVYQENTSSDELLKAVLLSGFGSFMLQRHWNIVNGKLKMNSRSAVTYDGVRVVIGSASVNHKRTSLAHSPFLTFFKQQNSTERRTAVVRETSVVRPLSVLLFAGDHPVPVPEAGAVSLGEVSSDSEDGEAMVSQTVGRPNILCEFILSEREATALRRLRTVIYNTLSLYYRYEGEVSHNNKVLTTFRNELVSLIAEMLNQYSPGSEVQSKHPVAGKSSC